MGVANAIRRACSSAHALDSRSGSALATLLVPQERLHSRCVAASAPDAIEYDDTEISGRRAEGKLAAAEASSRRNAAEAGPQTQEAASRQSGAGPALDWQQPPRYGYRAHLERMAAAKNVDSLKRRRDVTAYNNLMEKIMQGRQAYLLQDVYEEMRLDGVAPNWHTFATALSATMRQRMLPDAIYFFKEMQRCGFEPTSGIYAVLINAAGRAGQLAYALRLVEQMREKGVAITPRVHRALITCYAHAGEVTSAVGLLFDLLHNRAPVDVHFFTEAIRSVQHFAANLTSPQERQGAAQQIEEVLTRATEVFDLEAHPEDSDLLLKAAMDAYNHLGQHEAVCDAFDHINSPCSECFSILISSYAKHAIGSSDIFSTKRSLQPECYQHARRLLQEMEDKGLRMKAYIAVKCVLAGLKLCHMQSVESQEQLMEAVHAFLSHIRKSGQFLNEIYGSQIIEFGCGLGSTGIPVAVEAFRLLQKDRKVPDLAAAKLFLDCLERYGSGDDQLKAQVARIVRLPKQGQESYGEETTEEGLI